VPLLVVAVVATVADFLRLLFDVDDDDDDDDDDEVEVDTVDVVDVEVPLLSEDAFDVGALLAFVDDLVDAEIEAKNDEGDVVVVVDDVEDVDELFGMPLLFSAPI
jgi:hypothetical protein